MTKVESVQSRDTLVTTGAWKGTNKEKPYELCLGCIPIHFGG